MPVANASVLLNLAVAGTRYKLATLVSAIDATFAGQVNYMMLFSPFTNGAATIYVGDSLVTSSRYGFSLSVGGFQERIAPARLLIGYNELYLVADTDNTAISAMLELMRQAVT